MNALFSFVVERGKSLVSKKLGAAIVAEGAVTGTPLAGQPLMVYIIAQAISEAFKYWVDANQEE